MNFKHRIPALALALALLLPMLATESHAQAMCPGYPDRPYGYWMGEFCTVTNLALPNGANCLMEICYCYHLGVQNDPNNPDEYFIQHVREVGSPTGCSAGNTPADIVKAARLKLGQISCLDPDPHHPVGCTGLLYLKMSSPLCFRQNPVINGHLMDGLWQGCANSGECVYTTVIDCNTCQIINIMRSTVGSCSMAPGCMEVCY